MDSSTIVFMVMIAALVLYTFELIPMGVTSIAMCVVLAVTKTIPATDAFAGFSANVTLMTAGMMIVASALVSTGVVKLIGNLTMRMLRGRPVLITWVFLSVVAFVSAFLCNNICTAIFIPLVAGIVASSGGVIKAKNLYMPLAWTASAGGMLTLIGCTPQLIVQGVIIQAGLTPFKMFDFTFISLPLVLITIAYAVLIYPKIASRLSSKPLDDSINQSGFIKGANDSEVPGIKSWIAAGTMMLMIILFITQPIPTGLTAILGATIVIVSGCLSEDEAYYLLDWSTIMVIAGSLGLTEALDKTGAGKMLADTIIGWMGVSSVNPFTVFAVITGAAMLLTQIMSNNGVAALFAPIGLFLARSLGIDPQMIMIGVIIGASASMATPIGCIPNAMVLGPGKYRFIDYVKIGGPLNILLYLLTIILVPFIWKM